MTDIFGRDFFVPNDTAWRGTWNNFVNGTAFGLNWGVEAINAPHAWMHWAEQDGGTWQINRERHSNIRVGVIDTFFPDHEDLTFAGVFENTIPNNVSMSVRNHGIHVAGTIGADFNNDRGIAGVAPNAELYAYGIHGVYQGEYAQFLHMSSFDFMHGVGTLFANDVNVINISMGTNVTNKELHFQALLADGVNPHTFDINSELNNALRVERDFLTAFLVRYYELGHDFLIVQSAGNDSNTLHIDNEGAIVADLRGRWVDTRYGGLFRNITDLRIRSRIIVVGNMDGTFRSNLSSQVGERVDIFAPGTNILSTHLTGTLVVDGVVLPYRQNTGTSMAAPHVTGVIAMMWGVNPYLTGVEVADLLLNNPLRNISLDNNGNVQISENPRLITVRMNENGFNVQDPLVPVAITQNFPILDAAAAVNAALAFDVTGRDRNITERSRLVSGVVVLPDANGSNVDIVDIRVQDYFSNHMIGVVSHRVTSDDERRIVPFAFLLSTGRDYVLHMDIHRESPQRSYYNRTGIFAGNCDLTFWVIELVDGIVGITMAPFTDGLPQGEFIELVASPFDFLSPSARRVDGRVIAPIAPLIEHGFGYELFFVDAYDEIRIYTHDNQRVVMQIGYDHFRVENLRPADTPTDDAQLIDYAIFNYYDDVALQVINNSVFIPLRSVAEALGYIVHWDGETYTATIMRPSATPAQAILLSMMSDMPMPVPSLMIESGTLGRYRWR